MSEFDIFGKLKEHFGEFKMPEASQETYEDVSSIMSSDEGIGDKLVKLKDKFFNQGEQDESE